MNSVLSFVCRTETNHQTCLLTYRSGWLLQEGIFIIIVANFSSDSHVGRIRHILHDTPKPSGKPLHEQTIIPGIHPHPAHFERNHPPSLLGLLTVHMPALKLFPE